MNTWNVKDYPVVIESGKLLGSVRVVGDLPPDGLHEFEAHRFQQAIGIIRQLHEIEGKGHIVLVFTRGKEK